MLILVTLVKIQNSYPYGRSGGKCGWEGVTHARGRRSAGGKIVAGLRHLSIDQREKSRVGYK